ncbi:MAG: Lrp/AsnC family transcriptional regulator [Syntrophorhabdaceae bacterium]|nr:Lrp/AsnC family transcriptional regulator [Syntrophorhabdaceae bacterium]
MALDDIDRSIINILQEEFPLVSRPFAEIADFLHIEEEEVLERVKRLKKAGYIRRIGPVLERKKLMYASTLCGVRVKEEKLEAFIEELNRHQGVTHNYERDGDLNIWFTITSRTKEQIQSFLSELEKKYDVVIYRFPEKKTFKIKTFFPV